MRASAATVTVGAHRDGFLSQVRVLWGNLASGAEAACRVG